MSPLLPLVLLMVGFNGEAGDRAAHAAKVFHCQFDDAWDKDFVGWPDGWSRQRGPGFPFYVKIKIGRDAPPSGGRCLNIHLDGGAAAVFSPAVAVEPLFDYLVEAWVKTAGLKHDRVSISLVMMDGRKQPLQRAFSEEIAQAPQWQKLRIGPIRISNRDARLAMIGLHVEPHSGQDITGDVAFGDVWMGHVPQTVLETGDRHNFFTDPQKVEVRCRVTGVFDKAPEISLRLEDALGRRVDQILVTPKLRAANEQNSEPGTARIALARWSPQVARTGFYRLAAAVRLEDGTCDRRELTLAVVEPAPPRMENEFGWSLRSANAPLDYGDLGRLASQAGIGWVKCPLWLDPQGTEDETRMVVAFCQQLREQGIEPVGLLSRPPQSLLTKLKMVEPTAADLFTRSPDDWYPSLEPTMVRLAAQVGWWQLGSDTDTSLVDHPKLKETVSRVKKTLDRIGQNTRIGLAWVSANAQGAVAPEPLPNDPPWQFLSFPSHADDDPTRIEAALRGAPRSNVRRWVVIEPKGRATASVEARAADLVHRMAAAKLRGANVIFASDPFDGETGLMRPDGTPGELLLPWRTAALCLGGAQYLGTANLPHGAENHWFLRDDDAVMLVWSVQPGTERLSLGAKARQVDVWGRSEPVVTLDGQQVIRTQPTPSFIIGIDKSLAKWQQSLDLAKKDVSTTFGRPQENSVQLKNPFGEKISGHVTLALPDDWQAQPMAFDFELAPAARVELPFRVTLPYNAQSGRQQIRFDCKLMSDAPRQVSVYRDVMVDCKDLGIKVTSRLNEHGELDVVQRLINDSGKASFRCELFIPNRQRLAAQVINLGRTEDVQTYRIPQGAELIGKTLWLRIEEMGGPRVINHRFTAAE